MATNPPPEDILPLKIADEDMLYRCYMPFLKNGGLFIHSVKKDYRLGDQVFISLSLMKEDEESLIAGNVCWIMPKGSQGSQVVGIGVHFSNIDGGGGVKK